MKSHSKSLTLPTCVGALAVAGTVLGVCLWGIVDLIDRPQFEQLLLWLVLSLISVMVAALLVRALKDHVTETEPSLLETPLRLARDNEIFKQYELVSRAMLRISWRNDPIYRELALQQLSKMSDHVQGIAQGEIVFENTEVWRLAYEQLLRSEGLYQYRSVSWMTSDSYWQDGPGRQSLKLNLELHEQQQITVERIVIVRDSDWLTDGEMPAPRIRQWIHEQHVRGIWLALVRESQLASEPDLLADFGIYGSRAVGFQKVDEHARTTSFMLKFDFAVIEEAETRWKRLQVYATSYGELLDHFTLDE